MKTFSDLENESLNHFCSPFYICQFSFKDLSKSQKILKMGIQSCPTVTDLKLFSAIGGLPLLPIYEMKKSSFIGQKIISIAGEIMLLAGSV